MTVRDHNKPVRGCTRDNRNQPVKITFHYIISLLAFNPLVFYHLINHLIFDLLNILGQSVLAIRLLVDPREDGWLVLNQLLLLEPQTNLLVGRLNRVRTVSNVSTHVNGKVTSNGTWSRLQWVGGTQDSSTLLDDVLTLPDSSQDWARQHVRQQGWEEWLLLQVLVVLSQQRLRWGAQLNGNQLVASVLESGQDRGDQASLDSVWLNGNEGSLVRHCSR